MEKEDLQTQMINEAKDEVKELTDDIEENAATFDKIINSLTDRKIDYVLTTHDPAKTSQEFVDVRRIKIESIAKAMLIVDHSKKLHQVYFLWVMSAAKKLSWK